MALLLMVGHFESNKSANLRKEGKQINFFEFFEFKKASEKLICYMEWNCYERSEENMDNNQTQKIDNLEFFANKGDDIISQVYHALDEKGYNAVNQLIGYILSGDPTYITTHKNARVLIGRIERDELLEMFVKSYLVNELGLMKG